MKFSTITYFMIAFVMTFASTFGMADDVAHANNLRRLDVNPTEATPTNSGVTLRQLEIQALDEYHRDMELVDAKNGQRELEPDISCYLLWCLGKVRGTCYTIYKKCYPL